MTLRIFQVLVALLALLFLGMGLNVLIDPEAGAARFALVPEGVRGLNTLRGDMAGLFLGAALLLVAGLLRRESRYLLAVAAVMGAIALGRLVGFVLDGWAGNSLPEFVVEVVTVAVLVQTHRLSRSVN